MTLRINGTEIPENYTVRANGSNITLIRCNNVTVWQSGGPTPPVGFSGLTLTANQANSTVELISSGSPSWTGFYSADGNTWISYTPGSTGPITLTNVGDKIYFKGTLSADQGETDYIQFVMSGSIAASGNTMSMCSGDSYASATALPYAYCFFHLFQGCSALTTAPDLPATTITHHCYDFMFQGCGSLVSAPAILPADILYDRSYAGMFNGCGSLVTPPVISATVVAARSCPGMFRNCVSLTTAPALNATTVYQRSYHYMFNGCTSLTTAPALPATTLGKECYSYMFQGCTSLVTPPAELPATILKDNCYEYMFNGCTSLTSVPTLPATYLAPYCYNNMFSRCEALTTLPVNLLPSKGLVVSDDCIHAYDRMFLYCTSLTNAPNINLTTYPSYICYSMFGGCTSLVTPGRFHREWQHNAGQYAFAGMYGGCINLEQIPLLNIGVFSMGSCSSMFGGCTKIKLSATRTGEYTNSYTVSTTTVQSSDPTSFSDMFVNTGGTFTGDPLATATYYTSNTLI